MEAFHPIFQVREQKVQYLVFAVVKQLGPPGAVLAPGTVVEELVGCAVKIVDALPGVFAGTRTTARKSRSPSKNFAS